MKKLGHGLLVLSRFAAVIGAFFLLLVAGMSVADILFREFTGRPIRGAYDLAALLTIVIIASSFPAGLLERRQIKVTILGGFLPKPMNKAMEVLGAVLTGAMFMFIAYFVTKYAIDVSNSGQYTMVLGLPLGPWWWVASICFWVCIPAQIFVIISEILSRPTTESEV
jgi:TRAP-type C4-dicarboxylate transport system permease small subunit